MTIKHDYVQGNRELNLDLKMSEASKLFNASGDIRAMAESGELQAMHAKCSKLAKDVDTGYIKVMDQLDRTLQQVCDAE